VGNLIVMTKSARIAVVTVMSALAILILALPGFATEDTAPEEETSETTVVTTDIEPAVEVTSPPVEAAAADWTYRYMVPAGIALAILVIIATSGRYFTNVVRERYRIVEEE
jgi:hypothetical protein